jgi:hypothetical protein
VQVGGTMDIAETELTNSRLSINPGAQLTILPWHESCSTIFVGEQQAS